MSHRAVFLDRDGTLIEDKDYLHRPEHVVFTAGAAEALQVLRDAGLLLFMVTNQSGVGRGFFTLKDVEAVHTHISAELRGSGVEFKAIYIAPEHPDQPSRGRKPSPQFLFDARDQFDLDLSASFMIGDKWIDLECGWNAGVRKSILVRTGYGSQVEKERQSELGSALIADHLPDAARLILEDLKFQKRI